MVPIDHFDTAAALSPNAPAILDGTVSLTFADVSRLSHQVARAVDATSLPGTPVPVVVYSPNDYRVLVASIGIMRAGGVIVPVHAGNPVSTTERVLRMIRPRCAFYHSSLLPQVTQLRQALPDVLRWICLDATVDGDPSFDSIAAGTGDFVSTWINADGNRDRPVYYWSTSGTTGEPKVVVDDVVSFDGSMMFMRTLHHGRDREVSLVIAPMSHGAGPHSFTMLTLGGMVIVVRHFEAGRVLELIETHRVSDVWLPPTALYLLLETPNLRTYNVSSLRTVRLTTAAVSPERLKEALEVFGPCIIHLYGQIEAGFITTLDPQVAASAVAGERPERLRSAGRSVFVNRVAVMGEDGRLLPPGEAGEIVVRGRCVKRYLDDDATAEARRFGWHHTTDIGYLDESGFLYIVGRLKDMVNMAGLKIPAAEVERVIMELPDVRECAVVAIADAVRGEAPKAIVTIKEGRAAKTSDIIAHCRQRLGPSRSPVAIEQWPELPKSPAGKIDKHLIRARLESATGTA
jgi:fatty-acyl-CoA synthase